MSRTITREEARQIIAAWLVSSKGEKGRCGYIEGWFSEKDVEAFHMAIEALEYEQQRQEDIYKCQYCFGEVHKNYTYCPFCGKRIEALDQVCENDCDTCKHGEETDGMNCYECVKGIRDNYEPTAEYSSDVISRQAVIDGLEYEIELCNRALDDMDIDRKERERFEWELELVECFIEDIKELPSKEIINMKSIFNLSEDLISRQAAIEMVTGAIWHYPNECYKNLNVYEVAKALVSDAIKSLPSANRPKWIPCSERLPNVEEEEAYEVLCCDTQGNQVVAHPYKENEYSNTGFCAESEGYYLYDCVAWMPLPEPYNGGREK